MAYLRRSMRYVGHVGADMTATTINSVAVSTMAFSGYP